MIGFGLSIVIGTFLEYWIHRILHIVNSRKHLDHHRTGKNKCGILVETGFYTLLFLPLILFFYFIFGLPFLVGSLLFIFFMNYSHELQHAQPQAVFWMKKPIHVVHDQKPKMNFGITTQFWDWCFGTLDYKNTHVPNKSYKGYLKVKWI